MKKTYFLLFLIAIAFTACQKQPIVPLATPLTKTGMFTFTLAQSDYQLLPSSAYPYSSYSFNTTADADSYIPMILNAKESAELNDGSSATVTYTISAPQTVTINDSLYNDVYYKVTSADYVAVTGNTYGDFGPSDVLNFLVYKYPTPKTNQLAVINYILYSGGTDTQVVNSFLYLNGTWQKIYQVSPAQYTLVGDGTYNDFSSSEQSNLAGYFNFFLKNDITIADTVKPNDVEYVSYKLYAGKNYQKVQTLMFDGNNWGAPMTTTATGYFLKTNGTWAAVLPVPTINHTLTSADISLIAASNIGTAAERTNLGKYGDFDSSTWTPADLDSAFILVLTTDYPNPTVGDNYVINYLWYINSADVLTHATFQYNGTVWAAQ